MDDQQINNTIEAVFERVVEKQNRRLLEEFSLNKRLLNVRDTAKTLGVSVRTLETEIAEGQLRPLWIRGRRLFHPDTVDSYLRSRKRARRSGGD